MCGKLFCQGGQSDPNYGRMVSFGNCKAAFFDEPSSDFGQVDPGTRCGDGKVTATLLAVYDITVTLQSHTHTHTRKSPKKLL